MKVQLHFHNQKNIQIPENIKLVQDCGQQSVHVMDCKRRIVTGQVLIVDVENKTQLDEWLKQFPEVYFN